MRMFRENGSLFAVVLSVVVALPAFATTGYVGYSSLQNDVVGSKVSIVTQSKNTNTSLLAAVFTNGIVNLNPWLVSGSKTGISIGNSGTIAAGGSKYGAAGISGDVTGSYTVTFSAPYNCTISFSGITGTDSGSTAGIISVSEYYILNVSTNKIQKPIVANDQQKLSTGSITAYGNSSGYQIWAFGEGPGNGTAGTRQGSVTYKTAYVSGSCVTTTL